MCSPAHPAWARAPWLRSCLEKSPNDPAKLSVSATTRQPAGMGEVDGVHYHFVRPRRKFERGGRATPDAGIRRATAAIATEPQEDRIERDAWREGQDVILEIEVQGALCRSRNAVPDAVLDLHRAADHRGADPPSWWPGTTEQDEIDPPAVWSTAPRGDGHRRTEYDYVVINGIHRPGIGQDLESHRPRVKSAAVSHMKEFCGRECMQDA